MGVDTRGNEMTKDGREVMGADERERGGSTRRPWCGKDPRLKEDSYTQVEGSKERSERGKSIV